MAKRGRKSAEEQGLKVIEGSFGQNNQPPADLNPRQMEIWNQVVATEPSGFFDTEALRGLLADYCRHREASESISAVIAEFKREWLKSADGSKRYSDLLKMRDNETKAALRCATKLRLTNQSRYTPQAAATASRNQPKIAKPWEA